MTQYIIAPDAARDLDEISEYYAVHNIEAGEKLIDENDEDDIYAQLH